MFLTLTVYLQANQNIKNMPLNAVFHHNKDQLNIDVANAQLGAEVQYVNDIS